MREFLTIAFLFALGAVSAQQKRTVKDSVGYEFAPRYYNISPCYCPIDGNRINSKEYDPNNPYQYTDQKPIILKPGDSLLVHWLELERVFRDAKKDTVPVL